MISPKSATAWRVPSSPLSSTVSPMNKLRHQTSPRNSPISPRATINAVKARESLKTMIVDTNEKEDKVKTRISDLITDVKRYLEENNRQQSN
jgi:hypothetical protein